MKRRDLLRYLWQHGCYLAREGSRHSFFVNPNNNKKASVPRHREINDYLARRICRDLDIPAPKG